MPDFKARQKRLVALAERGGMDSILVTGRKDIRYYSGCNAASSFLLLSKSEARLFTTLVDNAAMTTARTTVTFYKKLEDVTKHLTGKVGVDYAIPAALLLKLRKSAKRARLSDASKLIKEPRSVKDDEELESIAKAVRLTKKVILATDPWDKTEKQVASSMEIQFLEHGSRRAFPIIVASGRNGYYIHHVPGQTKTKPPVIIDAGAKVNGYCADMTRTLVKGHEQRRILEEVQSMQKEILGFIRPDVKMAAVQKFWESLMRKKGYKVMHAFGHGIGLDVHERVETIHEGTVLAVEPGVYMQNAGGWRVEDIAVARKNGMRLL